MKRVLRHILFWLTFFCISLFNEVYLSYSFNRHPSLEILVQIIQSIALVYSVKLGIVYCFLVLLIPSWNKYRSRLLYYLLCIAVLLAGGGLIRLVTQQIIWVYVFGDERPQLSEAQLLARYFYSLLDLLQITGVAVALKLFKIRMQAWRREKMLMQEKLTAELSHLKSQTNPHFLFNALNSIYALTRKQSELAPVAVLQLSDILRYMLYETAEQRKPLSAELQVLENYIALQRLRYGSDHNISFVAETDEDDVLIVPLLAFPLVENAFKHSDSDALINILLTVKTGELRLLIANSVAGFALPGDKKEGIGLGNVRRRLELLYKNYDLHCSRENDRFIVSLFVDLKSYAGTELFDNRR